MALVATPLAYWDFSENGGTVLTDRQSGTYNGAIVPGGTAPLWSAQGLQFQGGQLVNMSTALLANGILTVQIACDAIPQLSNWAALWSNSGETNQFVLMQVTGNPSYGITTAESMGALNRYSGPCVITWTFGATCHMYYNGQEVIYNKQLNNIPGTGVPAFSRLGFYMNTGGFSYTGKMYYATMYTRQLSAAEVAANAADITATLAGRGVTVANSLNLSKPYYVMVGDSIVNNLGAGTMQTSHCSLLWSYLNNDLGPYNFTFQAHNGYTTAQIAALAPTSLDVLLGANPNSVVEYCGGANDLALTPAQIWSGFSGYATGRRAAGAKTLIGNTILSHTGVEPTRRSANALMRSLYPGFFDILNDVGGDNSQVGYLNAYQNTTIFQGDGIHLTQTGQASYAPWEATGARQVLQPIGISRSRFVGGA